MEQILETLLADGVIDEVLGRLKSGKEADIWIVRHGADYVAAKIYKERQARSFRNNAAYKEGRVVGNSRTQRAIERGSRFGQAAEEEAWKSAEADALFKLHAHGVRVPAPVMFYEGVLLMQLVADAEGQPAPRLIDVPLTAEAARDVYADLRAQVVRMLDLDVIHGDLSPYNVLLGASGPTVIDFPQIIAAAHNSSSESFFRRDLENIRQHLAAFAPELQSRAGDAAEIWRAYTRRELSPDFVPTGRFEEHRPRNHQRREQRGGNAGGPPQARGPGAASQQHARPHPGAAQQQHARPQPGAAPQQPPRPQNGAGQQHARPQPGAAPQQHPRPQNGAGQQRPRPGEDTRTASRAVQPKPGPNVGSRPEARAQPPAHPRAGMNAPPPRQDSRPPNAGGRPDPRDRKSGPGPVGPRQGSGPGPRANRGGAGARPGPIVERVMRPQASSPAANSGAQPRHHGAPQSPGAQHPRRQRGGGQSR